MDSAIRIGQPLHFGGLSVYPLHAESSPLEYQMADEAMAAGHVTVEEVSEGGSVPELAVENKGNMRVLFLEGEELVGAKQNRVLNTSVLVPPNSKTRLPVSCVERGRWRYRSRGFGSSGSGSSSSLRRILSRSVNESLKARACYRSDQGDVWKYVDGLQQSLEVSSETCAYSDTVDQHKDRIAEFRAHLAYIEDSTGLVVAVNGRAVALDLFDSSSTCHKAWQKLLTGFAVDALAAGTKVSQPSLAEVESFVESITSSVWTPVPPVGDGQAFRAETNAGGYASKLELHGAIVHASVLSRS